MYYFGYGANMSENEISKYTSYKFISYGIIKDYILVFRKILNHPRKSGVATIEPCKNKIVYGKIYWIDNSLLLDKKEGFLENPKIYNKHFMNINGYNCMLYILNPSRLGIITKPRKSYLKIIKNQHNIYMKETKKNVNKKISNKKISNKKISNKKISKNVNKKISNKKISNKKISNKKISNKKISKNVNKKISKNVNKKLYSLLKNKKVLNKTRKKRNAGLFVIDESNRNSNKTESYSTSENINMYRNSNSNSSSNSSSNNDYDHYDDDDEEYFLYDSYENNEMDEAELEEEAELIELVDNLTIDWDQTCCSSTSMSNISTNIKAIEHEICDINTQYGKLLKTQIVKAFELKHARGEEALTRSETNNNWYEEFKNIYIWQRYQESDLFQSMRYIIASQNPVDPDDIDLDSINETVVKRVIQGYIYKIICGYFTKASISYAIYNYGEYYKPISEDSFEKYKYLENFANLLNCSVTSINYELEEQWSNYVKQPMDMSSYVISGGNIFYLFAGILCYLYNTTYENDIEEHEMLEKIKNDIYEYLNSENLSESFDENLKELFEDGEFTTNIKSILSNASDMDFLFLSKHSNYVTHNRKDKRTIATDISVLSSSVLRSLLQKAHNNPSDAVTNMFPFIGQYSSDTWGFGKMFNLSGLTSKDSANINKYGNIKNFIGYRQSSTYISELPIYLNRIKQGYFPFNRNEDPTSLGISCINNEEKRKELLTKFGECIDLSIGSTNNPLYNMKYSHYLEGKYYSIECLLDELDYIEEHTNDDKSSKRIIRQEFLRRLQRHPLSNIFNFILVTIFDNIHYWEGSYYGYPCPNYDSAEEQIWNDKYMFVGKQYNRDKGFNSFQQGYNINSNNSL